MPSDAPFKQGNPGNPCCCGCHIFDTIFRFEDQVFDNFSVYEGEAEPTNVSWVSGTVEIVENPTTFVKVLCDSVHPVSPYAPRVTLRVKGGDGSIIRVLVSWSIDHQTGLIAELRPQESCSELRLIQVAGGVETVRHGPVSVPKAIADEWHQIRVCYDPGEKVLHAIVAPANLDESTEASVTLLSHADGMYAGFGTPDTSTKDVYFDNFDFQILWYWTGSATVETTQDGQSVGMLTVTEETKGGGGSNEEQLLTLVADDGTFTLTYEGETTAAIAYDASVATVEAALEGLSTIGSGNVSVSGSWLVEFIGALANSDLNMISADASGSTYNTGEDEVQTLTIDAVSGTYALSFDGEQTATFPYDADATTLQDALESLISIGSGNVTVTGANPFVVTFIEAMSLQDVDEIQIVNECLQDDECEDGYTDCDKTWCHDCQPSQCGWAVGHFDDEDNLTCEWENDTDDWLIDAANQHMETTAGSSIILHKSEYPWDDRESGSLSTIRQGIAGPVNFVEHHRLLVGFKAVTAGRSIIGIVAALDDENYLAAEVTVGPPSDCGTVKLISVTSGSPTDVSETHSVRGLISNGTFYLAVSFESGVIKAAVCTEPSMLQATQGGTLIGSPMDTPWIRHFRSEPGQTYHGAQVGVGVSGGTGEVDISIFEAGCQFPRDICQLEEDYFDYEAAAWRSCNWNLISGTLPTRVGGNLEFTSSALMLNKNPVTVDAVDDHGAGLAHAIFNVTGNQDKVAVVFGSDATATNYYRATHIRTDDGIGGHTLTSLLERVNSGTPTTLDSGTGGGVGVSGCISGAIANSSGFKLFAIDTPGSYGPYCGMEITPGAGHTMSVSAFGTNRTTGETLNSLLASSYEVRCGKCSVYDCSVCVDNEMPGEFLVEIDSWSSWVDVFGRSRLDNDIALWWQYPCCTCPELEGLSFYTSPSPNPGYLCTHVKQDLEVCTPTGPSNPMVEGECQFHVTWGTLRCCTGYIGAYVWISITNLPVTSATFYDENNDVAVVPSGLRVRALVYIGDHGYFGTATSTAHLFVSDRELTSPTDCLAFNQEPLSWIGRANNTNMYCVPEQASDCKLLITSIS